jgi:large subunit ribosomal protein L25
MTKENHQISAQVRTVLGRKVKHLRKSGFSPATVYGKGFTPISIQIITKELEKIYEQVGESGLVNLNLDKQSLPILFRNPQYHPVSGDLIHVDCYKVNLKEKITTAVPIELIGESFAVKEGNILVPVTEEVEVEALPTDLPESIIVDISALENVDSVITVADLQVDRSKVEILTDAEQVIVKVEPPKEEEEPAATEVAPGDVPATQQKTAEELAEAAEKKEDKEEK